MSLCLIKLSLLANNKSIKKNMASEIEAKAGEKCRVQRHKAAVATAALMLISLLNNLIKGYGKITVQHT